MMLGMRALTKEGSCRSARWRKYRVINKLSCLDAGPVSRLVLARGTPRPTIGHSDGGPSLTAVSLGVRQPQNRNGLLEFLES